ncbi:hypothetical protein [Nitrosomonas communis]|uniref:Uncharacterized protein n=1 Tax=Nitrosomonas communis TaxID=44574 RepID=A0A1I4P0W0_9PROT|nr:hypothetical protein [Nitrosomonas communis]SFM21379.1 hypothetical protein SAMN05421863_101755 [Nitrosomonas communis]
MKMLHVLIAAAFIAVSSAALATEPEPIALNDAQLDGLTAGAQVLLVVGGTAQASAASVGPLAVSAATTGTGATATAVDTGLFTHVAGGGSAATATSLSAN